MSAAGLTEVSAEVSTEVSTGARAAGLDDGRDWRVVRGRVGTWLGVGAVLVYCLAPFYWMVVSSLRRTADIFAMTPVPAPLSLENYAAVFDPKLGFGRALLNSTIVAGTTTVLALAIGTTTAYALARLEFRYKQLLLTAVIATAMFPTVTLAVPLLKLFTSIGWINTYQGLIAPTLSFALPLAVWNLTSFFQQMPRDLESAAMIDGCTRGRAFRLVILPIAAPGVFTTAILTFFGAWNEFLVAVTFANRPDIQTATAAVSKFTGATQFDTPFGTQMAAGVIVTIPLVLLVLLFQRRIVAGLSAGAEK
ncbi:MAG TPA: carbohydrate ABC transporter permease [Pseudonocardia sp.]|nr:carbohydrate ABC transporter permease [Pseudonocardia sp.]